MQKKLPPIWYSKAERFVTTNWKFLLMVAFYLWCFVSIFTGHDKPDWPEPPDNPGEHSYYPSDAHYEEPRLAGETSERSFDDEVSSEGSVEDTQNEESPD